RPRWRISGCLRKNGAGVAFQVAASCLPTPDPWNRRHRRGREAGAPAPIMAGRHTFILPSAFAAAMLLASVVHAQGSDGAQRGGAPGRGQAAVPRNLQVLAKDTPQSQILQTMQQFGAGLGVQCGYCHIQHTPTEFDFSSDEKPQKQVAREMMLM